MLDHFVENPHYLYRIEPALSLVGKWITRIFPRKTRVFMIHLPFRALRERGAPVRCRPV